MTAAGLGGAVPAHTTDADSSPGPNSPALLSVRGATVRYGGVTALSDLDLDLQRGELLGVVGPNGAGKTTLFDVISGHRRANSGRILLEGEDVTARSAVWRARHGMRRTFQRQQVFDGLTVEDNVLSALEWRTVRGGFFVDLLHLPVGRGLRAEHERVVVETLELCGISDVRREYAGSLPIGVTRMVELARATVAGPRVLLLDEPTSGLDAAEAANLSRTIRRVQEHHDCGVLLVEHDIGFVMEHSDRVLVLRLGERLAEGTPAEVRADEAVKEAYLG
jgi:branched-chain amino acid transport system ATP-binding protein